MAAMGSGAGCRVGGGCVLRMGHSRGGLQRGLGPMHAHAPRPTPTPTRGYACRCGLTCARSHWHAWSRMAEFEWTCSRVPGPWSPPLPLSSCSQSCSWHGLFQACVTMIRMHTPAHPSWHEPVLPRVYRFSPDPASLAQATRLLLHTTCHCDMCLHVCMHMLTSAGQR